MSEDLYARARALAVEAIGGSGGEEAPKALFVVVGEMMLEAMDRGLGARDLAEELRALAERVDSSPPEDMTEYNADGSVHCFMFKTNGVPFRCPCAGNVFHRPDRTKKDLYQCNSCGMRYHGE